MPGAGLPDTFRFMNFKGRWALITGASSGIGEATAYRLAELGANVILLARRRERLLQVAAKISSTNSTVQTRIICADLAQHDELQRALTAVPEVCKLSLLVNNAGLARGIDRIQHGQWDDWQAMINTNVLGLLAVTKICLPALLEQDSSHIVNIGSVAGRWVYPGGNVYCATKFAVSALTEGLRMDLLGKPVRVTNIEPGMVETEFSNVRLNDDEKARAVYAGMTPLTADDVAESIVWSITRPAHVNIAEIVLYPRDQASVRDVHRQT